MGTIELLKYLNEVTYEQRVTCSRFFINITPLELGAYAISVGGFSDWSISAKGEAFYRSLVDMAVSDSPNGYIMREDYSRAEQSIKTAISFFMGMIAAKAVAEKHYRIAYLFHLKDGQLEVESEGNRPDFFGLANRTQAILIEAKGTCGSKLNSSTCTKAKQQLNDICSIEVLGDQIYTNFEKHIIGCCFNENVMVYHDIDPIGKGKEKYIKFDIDAAMLSYYKPILQLFKKEQKVIIKNSSEFLVTDWKNYRLGLACGVYRKLEKYSDIYMNKMVFKRTDIPGLSWNGIYNEIVELATENFSERITTETYSIGTDGILFERMY